MLCVVPYGIFNAYKRNRLKVSKIYYTRRTTNGQKNYFNNPCHLHNCFVCPGMLCSGSGNYRAGCDIRSVRGAICLHIVYVGRRCRCIYLAGMGRFGQSLRRIRPIYRYKRKKRRFYLKRCQRKRQKYYCF